MQPLAGPDDSCSAPGSPRKPGRVQPQCTANPVEPDYEGEPVRLEMVACTSASVITSTAAPTARAAIQAA